MATQHPDNAFPSIFSGERFVTARDEIEECYKCFFELGVDEYMWDWEGKLVDEAVIDRLYQKYYDTFQKTALGKDKFLTFRIPNIWEEPSYRLPRAFMNLLSAEQAAKSMNFHTPPLFEIILPMTTRADQLTYLHESFEKIARATSEIFETKSELQHINIIPLFEQAETMAESGKILEEYVQFLEKARGQIPEYLRVFIARSDPAMNAGLIPCMLAVKSALSSYHEFGKSRGIEIYPWIGGGSLPFRGGINPHNVQPSIEEYKGASSITIQSAFRFDYPLDEVKRAIAQYNVQLPQKRHQYTVLTVEEQKAIQEFNTKAIPIFQHTIEEIADIINAVADKMPNHRERVQHVGIFGYSRGVGKVKLPRAIKFCGSLYSLGVPPEFIATGRVLKLAEEMGMLPLVKKLYVNIKADLLHAGHYLNWENLSLLTKMNPAWKEIEKDIHFVSEVLELNLEPVECHHLLHRNFTSNIFQKINISEDITEDILRAAEIRRSLG